MKFSIKTLGIAALFLLAFFPDTHAQELKHVFVNFENFRNRVFNDTMLIHKLSFVGTSDQGESLTGFITLSMCNCYCDSLWDAWPDCYPDCFKGNGTLGYIEPTTTFSSSDGGSPGPLKGRGTLGIKQMEGGIVREQEFMLPVKYTIEKQ